MAAVIAFQDWETALGITSGVGCAASAEPHAACIVMSASPAELLYSESIWRELRPLARCVGAQNRQPPRENSSVNTYGGFDRNDADYRTSFASAHPRSHSSLFAFTCILADLCPAEA
ncbi:hypothetical protein B296_00026593 [Ensete ventricosum]|uniref:Uncharacterized protein n=1 Tax=Ensete ventricosum TaxID=4639 RepID=A0A427ARD5_ENSVE|nr:hypothetical protein B296_00026593 [Ensete ventricosum]